mgnify:CR=1 FL=1
MAGTRPPTRRSLPKKFLKLFDRTPRCADAHADLSVVGQNLKSRHFLHEGCGGTIVEFPAGASGFVPLPSAATGGHFLCQVTPPKTGNGQTNRYRPVAIAIHATSLCRRRRAGRALRRTRGARNRFCQCLTLRGGYRLGVPTKQSFAGCPFARWVLASAHFVANPPPPRRRWRRRGQTGRRGA